VGSRPLALSVLAVLAACGAAENYTEEQARRECREALKQHAADLGEDVAELPLAHIRYFADVGRWMCTFTAEGGGNVTINLNPWEGTFEVSRRKGPGS